MADRSVRVRLQADVSSFVGQINAARRSVSDFAGDATRQARENSDAWEKVGTGMLVAGGAIGAGVGLAIKSFADFDKEMSNVQAVSGASAGQMQKLSAAALQAGADTAFSASEAAQATGELAKVGISTADILGGALTGALSLAAAGNLDLAQAAEISGQAMKLFNLQGKDVGHIADVLAAGANKSAADVTDLAQALSQGGLVAAQTGLTLDDTVGTLSAFADNALMGSDAGTSFKTMLQRLTPQSAEAKRLMDQLGLSAFDAQGNFVGITQYAGQLQVALGKMSVEQRNAALQTLFGSDAIRAATVLYNLGADGVQNYVSAVNDQGAATRVAAINMDNLAGDVEQLKGSLETLLIKGGETGNGPLRALVQDATAAVNVLGGLPKPVRDGAFALAAASAAALLAGGSFLTLVPKVLAADAAMKEATRGAIGLKTALRGMVVVGSLTALVQVGNAISKWVAGAVVAKPALDDLADSLDRIAEGSKSAGAFGDLFTSGMGPFRDDVTTTSQALDKFAESANTALGTDLGQRWARLTSGGFADNKFAEQAKQLDAAMAEMVKSGNIDGAARLYDQLMASIERANEAGKHIPVDEVAAKFGEYQAALDSAKSAQQQTAVEAEGLGGAINGVQVSAQDATDAVDKLVQSLAAGGLVQLSVRDATRQWKQSLDDVSAAIKENGTSMDINTEKGRKNQETLDAVAQSALAKAQATYDATKATQGTGPAEEAFRDSLLKSRETLIKQAERFGLTKKQARAYADQVLNIPAVRNTEVTLSGAAAAISKAGQIAAAIAKIPGRKTTDIVVRKIGAQNDKLVAAGGLITGPGTGTSDSIPAMLSNGEYVVKAAAVAKYGVHTFDRLNAMRYANGGPVGHRFVSAPVSNVAPSVTVNAPGVSAVTLPLEQLDYLADRTAAQLGGALLNDARRLQAATRNRPPA